MGRGAAPTARKARGGRAPGASTWRGGTRRPRTVLPVATPLLSLPGARLPRCPGRASGRFSGRGRGGRGARRSGEAAGRGWRPCAALLRPFLPAPLREGCSSRGPETPPGEAGGARCRPRLFKGSAGSATAQPANPAGAETSRRGRVGSCSSLLLFGLFFLERIKAATQPKLEALSIFL